MRNIYTLEEQLVKHLHHNDIINFRFHPPIVNIVSGANGQFSQICYSWMFARKERERDEVVPRLTHSHG
jgi:hypothetical protein